MSGTQPATATSSTSNFIAIFEAASKEYKKLTKQDLKTHPFSVEFDGCDSPDAVMSIFRKHAEIFDEIRKGDERLMKWLDPMVNILFTFSAVIGEGVGLVSLHGVYSSHTTTDIFSGILTCKCNIRWCRGASYSEYPELNTVAHRLILQSLRLPKMS